MRLMIQEGIEPPRNDFQSFALTIELLNRC